MFHLGCQPCGCEGDPSTAIAVASSVYLTDGSPYKAETNHGPHFADGGVWEHGEEGDPPNSAGCALLPLEKVL